MEDPRLNTMHRMTEEIGMSPPMDTSTPYNSATLTGKTILLTGGAAGMGEAYARRWASHGAFLIIGDLNDEAGEALVASLCAETKSNNHFFIHCDVTSWTSQVNLFKRAIEVSPTGGIDAVVPNAGVRELLNTATGQGFENPLDLDGPDPPPPDLTLIDVNLTGVLYTVHLALFWLPRNGKGRDRHILLIGSYSCMVPLAGQPLYAIAKHGVMGLFRSLRGTSWRHGVRVNIVCPYFIDTNFMIRIGLVLLAGAKLAEPEEVVDTATRFMADEAIVGRALVVGPRIRVEGEGQEMKFLGLPNDADEGSSAWECHAHDYDSTETFVWRYTRMLNAVELARGWSGWLSDIWRTIWWKSKKA